MFFCRWARQFSPDVAPYFRTLSPLILLFEFMGWGRSLCGRGLASFGWSCSCASFYSPPPRVFITLTVFHSRSPRTFGFSPPTRVESSPLVKSMVSSPIRLRLLFLDYSPPTPVSFLSDPIFLLPIGKEKRADPLLSCSLPILFLSMCHRRAPGSPFAPDCPKLPRIVDAFVVSRSMDGRLHYALTTAGELAGVPPQKRTERPSFCFICASPVYPFDSVPGFPYGPGPALPGHSQSPGTCGSSTISVLR